MTDLKTTEAERNSADECAKFYKTPSHQFLVHLEPDFVIRLLADFRTLQEHCARKDEKIYAVETQLAQADAVIAEEFADCSVEYIRASGGRKIYEAITRHKYRQPAAKDNRQ